jgi:hypothetical protein
MFNKISNFWKSLLHKSKQFLAIMSNLMNGVIQGQSDIKGTSVCYIWPVCDISVSLAYIGTSGRVSSRASVVGLHPHV